MVSVTLGGTEKERQNNDLDNIAGQNKGQDVYWGVAPGWLHLGCKEFTLLKAKPEIKRKISNTEGAQGPARACEGGEWRGCGAVPTEESSHIFEISKIGFTWTRLV